MSKPVSEWTEDDVLSLPAGEDDSFERKGARSLDLTLPGANEGAVLDELAKQLSAFSNTEGGQIIYGVGNAGTVDNGGVARSIKGRQSTKEWLEDVIPILTDFEIVGFNVHEITPKAIGSSLAADKSIYVVEVPNSERAPHQSKRDLKYYVRLGGKSRPASHRLIEDIRNRARHPNLEAHDLQIVGAVVQGSRFAGLRSEFELCISVRFGVRNKGRVRVANACLEVSATVPLSTNLAQDTEYFPRSATPGTVLLELKNPLYPGMGVVLGFLIRTPAVIQVQPVSAPLTLSGLNPGDVIVSVTSFADSAPARKQEFKLGDIDPSHRIAEAAEQEVKRIRSSDRQERSGPPKFGQWS